MKKYLAWILFVLPITTIAQYIEPDLFKKEFIPAKSVQSSSALLNQYDQKFVHIDISANASNVNISGSVNYLLQAKNLTIDTIYFEFSSDFIIDSVKVNFQNSLFYMGIDSLLIFPATPINPGNQFTTQIWYHRIPGATVYWNDGLKNTRDSTYHQNITWTLSESFHLRDWMPCKQDLTDRFDSAWIYITVDSTLKAGSNGKLKQITQLPNGKIRFEWRERYPIVYYLLSFAVGKYNEYNLYAHPLNYPDSILIQNYVYSDSQFLPNNYWNFSQMAPIFELYCNKFGLYPWPDEKFGHALVPLGGGMEHQTMTSLGYLSPDLVAHELTHQWFGDHITCANWQDIWINEGFATYGEYIFHQNLESQTNADNFMKYCHEKAKLEPNGSIYVPFNEVWNEGRIFNGNLSYKKGGAVIHMLRYLCNNDSLFYAGLKQLNTIYANNVLTGEDVKHVYENITGQSFQDFFDQWYYGEGYPIYKITWSQDSAITGFSDLTIKLEQQGSSLNNPLFTIPLPMKILFSGVDSIVTVQPVQNIQNFVVNTNYRKVQGVVFDPENWILDSLVSISQEVSAVESDRLIIDLYPNPASDKLYFSYSGPVNFDGEIKILDLTGKEITSQNIRSNSAIIHLTGINSGLYMAELSGNHMRIVRKLFMIK